MHMEQLKDKLVSSFIVIENELKARTKADVFNIRHESMEQFEKLGFPTRRHEEWKYTNLKPILKYDYTVLPKADEAVEFKDVKRYFLNDADTYRLVFINGIYSSWLSKTTHQEYDICTFSAALKRFKNQVEKHFAKYTSKDEAMVSLNTAFAKDGAYIHVPKGKVVDRPVEVVFFTTGEGAEVMTQPRNLIIVEENAEIQLVERHVSLTDHAVLTNVVTELVAERSARVQYYKVQNDNETASLIDNTVVQQAHESNVTFGTFTFGGKLVRNNLSFTLNGEHSETHMDGITIIGQGQHVDHHTLVDHAMPNCYSRELYKGIYDDNAKGVFNGKVIVREDAQKTNAFQQNNNVLLSDKASVDTKPQLEIFADDVKCSHGCTVGQLDEDALFYLRSRGIPEREAKALLMYAFSSDALNYVHIPELRRRLNLIMSKKLGVDLEFAL
jgi:Fe-S cluster assembly protein SufD